MKEVEAADVDGDDADGDLGGAESVLGDPEQGEGELGAADVDTEGAGLVVAEVQDVERAVGGGHQE